MGTKPSTASDTFSVEFSLSVSSSSEKFLGRVGDRVTRRVIPEGQVISTHIVGGKVTLDWGTMSQGHLQCLMQTQALSSPSSLRSLVLVLSHRTTPLYCLAY